MAQSNVVSFTPPTIHFEKPKSQSTGYSKTDKVARWAKAKQWAHDELWFNLVLPRILRDNGVRDVHLMNRKKILAEITDLWNTKSYEIGGELSAYLTVSSDDTLTDGIPENERPTRYDSESGKNIPINLNALATIGSNDFRYYVMKGDENNAPLVPYDCFFGTYPVKDAQKNIIKGEWRLVMKQKI